MPDTEPADPAEPAERQPAGEHPVQAQEQRRLLQEKKDERYVWWYLAYFLFGIHIVAFVMIYAVMHAK
ncbi:hypothetical protein [Streptomyces sp. NPDC050704]|uniref:hypothetical protein n=1 Tax=Streptomyces sp. NPDC050704 TaxID=3157219 RepID=UPI00342C7422